MRKVHTKRIVAVVTSLAMILTSANLSEMSAQAASKKGSVKLNKASVSLKVKKSVKLKIVKKNIKKMKSQKWSSKNKKIATVTNSGKVTAKKKGTTTVTCKVKYVSKGSKKVQSKTLKCKVKVTDGETTPTTTVPAAATTAAVSSPTTSAAVTTTAPQQPSAPVVTDVPNPADSSNPEETTVPSVSTEPTEEVPGTPTPVPTIRGLIEGVLTAEEITLRIPMLSVEESSNVGEERTVSIVGGTSESMVVRDNGTVRKDISATEIVQKEMGPGINLGNTMEATLPLSDRAKATEATQFEQAWGAPITTQEYIDVLKTYGINTIRIPVAWSNMIDDNDPEYTIPDKYLGRVEEIVNYALNDGMYVIINDHWDSGWWGMFGAAKKDPSGETYVEDKKTYARRMVDAEGNIVADEERRAEAWKRYESFWTQIATRFQGYSDHLIFEGANEELGDRLNDAIYENGYGSTTDPNEYPVIGCLTKDECYQTANDINQKFVEIIRASGGNNEYRFLLIPGYNTDLGNTGDERFKMPQDTEENGTKKLFLSVHYYTPNGFCLDDGGGAYRENDRKALPKYFANLQRFKDAGYAIIIGECGVCQPLKARGSVSQWFNDTFTEARKYNAVPVFWETGQYFDRANAKLKFHDIAVFYNTITQSNGDESMTKETGFRESAVEAVDVTGKTPVWSWTGRWYKNDGNNMVGDDKFEDGGGTKAVKGGEEFVPVSNTEASIEGDTTAIEFNEWGYQAFIKFDVSKYKEPAIAFTFLDGTDILDNVGGFSGDVSSEAKYSGEVVMDYEKFHGKAITLSAGLELSEENPWLAITFANAPIVTGIYIYEMAD